MILPQSIQIDYDVTHSTVYPSQTYTFDFESGQVYGSIDDLDAVKQAITKILLTDRYAYEIYDGYYGNELYTLVGKPYDYVVVEIPRMLNEALLRDERVLAVTGYSFKRITVDSIEIEFQVDTIYGRLDINSKAVI